MHATIKNHFKKADARLFKILEKIGDDLEEISPILPKEYFFKLCREIIAQQLGSKVADKFLERFIALFPKKRITPKNLLKLSDIKLRGIGISWAKVRYLKDLASKIENKEIDLKLLKDLKDEDVMFHLTKVKGIGNWTAEMFLMFSLGRQNIFSHGDLGLRKAIEKIYNLKDPKKEKIERLTQKWSPYRTWACRILWSSHDLKK